MSGVTCTAKPGKCPRNQPSGNRFRGKKKCSGCDYARVWNGRQYVNYILEE
jgi:hypothetical protein